MHIAIIGAGLSGLSCAAALAERSHAVTLFDKGGTPGGRMATRHLPTPLGPVSFDHGAQYFTARDEAFRAEVNRWQSAGLVAPWPAAGTEAWVGVPGMNAATLALARGRDLHSSARVEAVRNDAAGWHLLIAGAEAGPFDALVVAVPAEQVGALIAPWDATLAAEATATPGEPCWTVMAAFAQRLPIAVDVLSDKGLLGWTARNSAKPARSGPEAWIMQAGPAWSRQHLEDMPEDVGPILLSALAEAAGDTLPDAVAVAAHRWRFARSGRLGRDVLWNPDLRLGVCGDWLRGPRIECAWLSGQHLAREIR